MHVLVSSASSSCLGSAWTNASYKNGKNWYVAKRETDGNLVDDSVSSRYICLCNLMDYDKLGNETIGNNACTDAWVED